jgi:hypothetical protein
MDRPNGTAVNVAITTGWVAADDGIPLPPTSPARNRWNTSER